MENILNAFVDIAKNEGITITALETKLGASKGVLSRAIKKNTDIQAKWVKRLVEIYPHYNEAWILTGKGNQLKIVEDIRGGYDKIMQMTGMDKAMENIEKYSTDKAPRDIAECELENDLLVNKLEYLTKENKLLTEMIELIKKRT